MVGNTQCTLSSSCFSSSTGVSGGNIEYEAESVLNEGSSKVGSWSSGRGGSAKQSGRDEVELVRYRRLREFEETMEESRGSSLMVIP